MGKGSKYKKNTKQIKEADLKTFNRPATAKPAPSLALKNRLFWFDSIRCGLQALAGRRHRRTTSCD
jgi:hypothetical protein